MSRDPKNPVSNLYPFLTLSVRIWPIVSFGTNVPCISIIYLNLVSYILGRIFSNTVVIRKLWNDCHISYIFIIKCRHLVCICNWIPQFSAHTMLMWLLLHFLCLFFNVCNYDFFFFLMCSALSFVYIEMNELSCTKMLK